uniref:Uncharacterized protein n=1 Tax=Setaria italica TaxID=4555 RepID=K3YLB9_SETIT
MSQNFFIIVWRMKRMGIEGIFLPTPEHQRAAAAAHPRRSLSPSSRRRGRGLLPPSGRGSSSLPSGRGSSSPGAGARPPGAPVLPTGARSPQIRRPAASGSRRGGAASSPGAGAPPCRRPQLVLRGVSRGSHAPHLTRPRPRLLEVSCSDLEDCGAFTVLRCSSWIGKCGVQALSEYCGRHLCRTQYLKPDVWRG